MSSVIKKTIDEICCMARRWGSLTVKAMNEMAGDYPVYAAANGKPVGYIDRYQLSEPSIIVPTAGNGTAGRPYVVSECHYTIGANAIGLIPKENIDITYLFFMLNNLLIDIVKGESFKSVNQKMIKKIKVVIPVNEDGEYDLEEQIRLSGIYSEIKNQKEKLINRKFEIEKLCFHIKPDNSLKYKNIPLNDIIIHHNGNSIYTKVWCYNHSGEYPVYSANNYEPIAFMNYYDYDGRYLTYSKNGCAGYITIIDGRFSANGDRCVITIKDEYNDVIDLWYLKYFLEPIFRSNKKGRLGDKGKNEFTKLNSSMIKRMNIMVPIPVDEEGAFDLEKQKEIAEKYLCIDEIKQGIKEKIEQLISINVIPANQKDIMYLNQSLI